MTVTIVGSQLGDEGKGGIVDVFGEPVDVVVRYQGGDNAGHTVVHGGEEYRLSLVPSGAVRGAVNVLGNGCVVNPATLFEELDGLRDRGIDPDVRVAERAHVILPYHRVLDGIEEDAKGDAFAAGTTGRGIGPAYEDKAGRRGVRVGDLLEPDALRARLEYVVPQKRALVANAYDLTVGEDVVSDGDSDANANADADADADVDANADVDVPADAFDVDTLYEEYRSYGERLREADMTVNCGAFLARQRDEGKRIMFEGAQGTGLDIDHGIYPYVTSSNPSAGGAAVGSGLGPDVVGGGEVIGIVKAYLSRVGTGPLPTELGRVEGQTPSGAAPPEEGDVAEYIREAGGEYGTVTGRPRRVGWLDMPMLRHATRVNGFTGIAINHLDVLSGLDPVKVCHAYSLDGQERLTMPTTTERWGRCEATLREFPGWPDVNWEGVAADGYDAIPENGRSYLEYVSDELGVPIYAVGVGPGREETIVLREPFG